MKVKDLIKELEKYDPEMLAFYEYETIYLTEPKLEVGEAYLHNNGECLTFMRDGKKAKCIQALLIS